MYRSSAKRREAVMVILPEAELLNDEDRRQYALLTIGLGMPGSGMVRYGAAMYFHRSGRMGADLLEAYRICCKLDHEDVLAVMASRKRG